MSTIKADNIATLAGVSTSMANAVNGSAKAWVNFNGTGTVAIRQSYNVSSITDNGTGQYTINFTNALTDANYRAVGSAATNFGVEPAGVFATGTNAGWYATGSFRFFTYANGGGTTDYSIVNVAIFR